MQRSTGQYKIRPIKIQVRELLGHPYPQRIPKGVFVEQWIGISTDEFHRAKDADVAYMRNVFPLIDLGLSRAGCQRLLRERGDALAEAEAELELGDPDGCSPWSCRSGSSVQDDFDITA